MRRRRHQKIHFWPIEPRKWRRRKKQELRRGKSSINRRRRGDRPQLFDSWIETDRDRGRLKKEKVCLEGKGAGKLLGYQT